MCCFSHYPDQTRLLHVQGPTQPTHSAPAKDFAGAKQRLGVENTPKEGRHARIYHSQIPRQPTSRGQPYCLGPHPLLGSPVKAKNYRDSSDNIKRNKMTRFAARTAPISWCYGPQRTRILETSSQNQYSSDGPIVHQRPSEIVGSR